MKSFCLFILGAFILFVSCKKDGTSAKTKTELMTSASWKYENASIDSDNDGSGDTPVPPGILQPCQTDNVLIFSSNGSGTVDEGATKCSAGDPQTVPFTWEFKTNETVLNFSSAVFAGASGEFKIITLNETQLVLSKQIIVPPIPLPITVIATFKH